MPMHHVVLASGAVVAVSVAVATMIAVYESPEFRRYTDDVRRRLAMMFDSAGDIANPPYRPPRFNRPEDADGFFLSRRAGGVEPGVDADEESCRRQREELLYWNAVRMEKQRQSQNEKMGEVVEEEMDEKRVAGQVPPRPSVRHRGSSFDDFLRPDESGEKGSYVFNSGADVNSHPGLRHRGARSAAAPHDAARQLAIPADAFEIASDIYSATTIDRDEQRRQTLTPAAGPGASTPTPTPTTLVDLTPAPAASAPPTERSATVDRLLPDPAPLAGVSAPHEDDERRDVFASIQAWAHDSSRDFYSPLPVTPVAPVSEPELVSEAGFSEDFSDAGELTPIDSLSLAGSGEDVGFVHHPDDNADNAEDDQRASGNAAAPHLLWQHPESDGGRAFDVMSESEGMATPASWSEVGSVISESEAFPARP